MMKIILTFFLLIAVTSLKMAMAQSVPFENISFEKPLKNPKNNKLIFLDFYTDWCGLKWMDKHTFAKYNYRFTQ